MKFDYIIMNPPFGLNNSVAKNIVKDVLTVSETVINLVPKNTYKDKELFEKVEKIEIVPNAFKDACVQNLSIAKLKNNHKNTSISFENLCLTDNQIELAKAIHEYNNSHKTMYNQIKLSGSPIGNKLNKNILKAFLSRDYNKTLFEDIKDFTLKTARDNHLFFVITVWTPSDGVHINQAHDWTYNLQGVWDPEWDKGCPVNALVFPTKESRDNFRDWWYSCLKVEDPDKKKQRLGLTNAFLGLIRDAVSSAGGSYLEYFPHLDWSHPWTDEEILEEIGLPKDFLKKGEL